MRIFFLEQNFFLIFKNFCYKQAARSQVFLNSVVFSPSPKKTKMLYMCLSFFFQYSFYFLHRISNLPRAMPSLEWYPNKILGISGKRKSNCRFSANLDLI